MAERATPDLYAIADQVQLTGAAATAVDTASESVALLNEQSADEQAQIQEDTEIDDTQADDESGEGALPDAPDNGESPDGQAEDDADAEATDEEELDFSKWVTGKPNPTDPYAKSLQANTTRILQKAAEERKAIQAERESLGQLSRIGELLATGNADLNLVEEALRAQLGQASTGYVPPPQPAAPYAAPVDPQATYAPPSTDEALFAADEWIGRLSNALVDAATIGEQVSLEFQIQARKQQLVQEQQNLAWQQEQARQTAWQQQQARSASLTDELTRLKADPRYSALLKDPKNTQAVLQFAAAHGHASAEEALFGRFGSELLTIAQTQARIQGRNGREKARGASLAQPRGSTNPVTEHRSVEWKTGMSLSELADDAIRIGAVKLKKG